MVRPSQRHLADTFLWIGLLLLLFGIADLFPTSNVLASSSSLAPAPPSLPHLRSSYPSDPNTLASNTSTRATNRHLRAVPYRPSISQSLNRHPVRADVVTACQFTKSNPHLVADSRGNVHSFSFNSFFANLFSFYDYGHVLIFILIPYLNHELFMF